MKLKRLLTLGLLLLPLTEARAQVTTADAQWSALSGLHAGTLLRIAETGQSETCYFLSATADALRCEERKTVFFFFTFHRPYTVQRSDIRVVKYSHRTKSAVVGGLIGAAAGAGAGAAIGAGARNHEDDAYLVVLLGGLGEQIGQAIGSHKDFLAGPVIYQRP